VVDEEEEKEEEEDVWKIEEKWAAEEVGEARREAKTFGHVGLDVGSFWVLAVVAVVGVPSGGKDAKRVVCGFILYQVLSFVVSFRVPCGGNWWVRQNGLVGERLGLPRSVCCCCSCSRWWPYLLFPSLCTLRW